MNLLDVRRLAPRIPIEGLCGVVANDNLRHAAMLDMSTTGLRLERVFDPKSASSVVQLEIELPGVDEVVWAKGLVTFAFLSPMPGRTADGQPRFWCRAGLRLDGVCTREKRMLRDYVVETIRTRGRGSEPGSIREPEVHRGLWTKSACGEG
ncbi:MAG: PilZ domain-containing protein [Deltaproteobacteria bacterium]|nr:PilZ domain-containing protein [Deltaproteobacteria bacterium]